ncbi:TIGR03621 family F420-dependent LLM class oxidoreductase [Goodfellowiella coeruleoviolacea]|nr:TIGR03621 family F420-dependent LLM class oxidoreductase [Goodfellowiella coeruleoviolacea]
MSDWRFGVALTEQPRSTEELANRIRALDELGLDVVNVGDHLGWAGPFETLVAAATASSRLRFRTYVLNAGFWNPALLARSVATTDVLTGGRLEVGVGAGYMRAEHEDAGLPWLPFAERIDHLTTLVTELRRRLADPEHQPRPVQDRVPVLVGAASTAGLTVAAQHADIVGLAGVRPAQAAQPGILTLVGAEETERLVRGVREQAGDRELRVDLFLQRVELGRDPAEVAAEIVAALPHVSAEQVLDSPHVLLARTAEEAAEEVVRRGKAYGITELTTHEPFAPALAEVAALLR